jgi:ferredoxin-NADP reductase
MMIDTQPYQRLRIAAIIPETSNTKRFVLEQLSGPEYRYKPGQFLTLVFQGASGEERRSYSITSVAALNEPLSITVKRVENGAWSRHLIDHAQVGDELMCAGVSGMFVLPEDTSGYKQVFFLAAGSGISPVFALIKQILHSAPWLNVVLIYSNKSAADTIFYKDLIQLAEKSKGRLKIDFLFSSSNNLLKSRLNNSLLTSMLQQHQHALRPEILCYICGPLEYMDTVSITLLTEGIPRENIRKENFVVYHPETNREPEDKEPHEVRIRLSDDRVVAFTVQYPVSILQQAKKEGIHLPYSCESGQCGGCTARCTHGRVWIAYNEVLTDRELEQGLILTCQGFPVGGDIEINYSPES